MKNIFYFKSEKLKNEARFICYLLYILRKSFYVKILKFFNFFFRIFNCFLTTKDKTKYECAHKKF